MKKKTMLTSFFQTVSIFTRPVVDGMGVWMAASLKCCHFVFALLTPDPDGKNTSKDPLSGFDGGGWGLATTDHVWD